MAADLLSSKHPVLHVVVVGFHHKKGCQVDYSYPPLISGGEVHSTETPAEWKNLPSLAIPDGAHNYVKDTIYFHLPAREGCHRTVHGVACYRQIDSKDLRNKTDDITRSTVQKSVCVLSYLPLYGLIQAKLELITHAYFDELDFSKVSLLEETYKNLNASLTDSLLDGGSQVFLGMTVRDVVLQFKHKIVLLFKLIMLERRVLFTGTPVEKLCNFILSILSLFPGMIEHGLIESANYGIHKHISQNMKTTSLGSLGSESDDFMEIRYSSDSHSPELRLHCNLDQCNSEEPESPTMERGDRMATPEHSSHCDNKNNVQLPSSNNNTMSQNPLFKDSFDPNYYANSCDKDNGDSSKSKLNTRKSLEYVEDHYNGETSQKLSETALSNSKNSSNLKTKDAHSLSDGNLKDRSHGQSRKAHDLLIRSFSQSGEERPHDVKSHDQARMRHYSAEAIPDSRRVLLSESSSLMMGVTLLETVQTGVETDIPKNDSVINIEDLSTSLGTAADIDFILTEREKLGSNSSVNSLNLDETSQHSDIKDDDVEELDSPESISQIDREDCFSWEEDRLLLAIDENAKPVDDTAGLVSSFKENSILEKQFHRMNSQTQSTNSESDNKTDLGKYPKDLKMVVKAENGESGQKDGKQGSPESSPGTTGIHSSPGMKAAAIKNRLSNAFSGFKKKGKQGSQESPSEPASPAREIAEVPLLPELHQDDMGFPLAIFTKGSICHPYLSLQYFDLMNDVNVRSFVIGATNILFRQKRHLTDVVIDINESRIDLHDRELQRQLTLTTADLRFADLLVKAVTEQSDDIYLDGTEWEGSDEWLRAQFRLYIESMCATVLSEDPKMVEDFGQSFIQTWKTTHNYRVWASGKHSAFDSIQKGHPYQGNLGVADIRVRLAHTMQSTERGKKISAAASQTGKYVVQTGKVVGGAITQAKSSLSSWFSNLTNEWKATDKTPLTTAEHPAVHKPTQQTEKS